MSRPFIRLFSLFAAVLLADSVGAADYHVAKSGNDGNFGTESQPLLTIQRAADAAQSGDRVIVHAGVYRERIVPPRGGEPGRPIVYEAAPDEVVALKGSDVWTPRWKQTPGTNVFYAQPDSGLFTDTGYVDGGDPYEIDMAWHADRPPLPTPSGRLTLGQVFVDGRMFDEVCTPAEVAGREASWCYDRSTRGIHVHFPSPAPEQHVVELTTRRGVFRPLRKGLGHIVLRGFFIEHCGNQFPSDFWREEANYQSGMVGTRGGHHWRIENNVIRYAKGIGLTFGNPGRYGSVDNERPRQPAWRGTSGHHVIRNNVFFANGCIGAMGAFHENVTFTGNVFLKNNILQNRSPETGGIKTHNAHDLVIEQNLFLDNDCEGIWIDNTVRNARVSRNAIVNSNGVAMFFEMDDSTGQDASVFDNNVIFGVRKSIKGASYAFKHTAGVYLYDFGGLVCTHNLIAGTQQGFYARKGGTARKGPPSNISVVNNLFADNRRWQVALPWDWTEDDTGARDNRCDCNIYQGTRDFVLHTFGHLAYRRFRDPDADIMLSQRKLQAAIEAAWASAAPDKPSLSRPFEDENRGYYVDFDQWRRLREFDDASRFAPEIDLQLDRNTLTLEITMDQTIDQVAATNELGGTTIEVDYFGRPIGETSRVGPFQQLAPGPNRFPLVSEEMLTRLGCADMDAGR